jgi:hypothetical protein
MDKHDILKKDILLVNEILLKNKIVQTTVLNQIRLFLNGNPNSHLYTRFSRIYANLWGKYPDLTNQEIENVLTPVKRTPLQIKYEGFSNIENAKTFKEKDLEALTDWDILPEEMKDTKVFHQENINGRTISFNSEPEWNTYQALKAKGLIQSFRAQSLLIPYQSYVTKDRKHYPDFIFLTPEGYIAIVESKPIEFMANFLVQAKYLAMQAYCEQRGFLYAMMDEHLQSFESIKNTPINNEVTDYVDHLLSTAHVFNDDAFDFVITKFKNIYTQKELKRMIAHHIIVRQLRNTSYVGYEIDNLRKINLGLLKRQETPLMKTLQELFK